MLTAEQLRNALNNVHTLEHKYLINADGTPQHFRINGAIKTWKRDQYRIYIPLKRGLHQHEHIDSVCEFFEHFSI